MALETYRQLTKGGGLTIPRLLRQETGVHPCDQQAPAQLPYLRQYEVHRHLQGPVLVPWVSY